VGFFTFFMVWQPMAAYAAQASATVICQNSVGETQEFRIGWNNENDYFLDKGNIPQHFCEGGFAAEFTTFVSVLSLDGGELDSSLLYHPGYSPSPSPSPVPSPEPTPEVSPEPEVIEPTPEPTLEPTPQPSIEPTPEVVEPSPEPTPEVVAPEPTQEPTPEPVVEPSPEPTVEPTPKPKPAVISPVKPVEPITPEISPSPSPTPVEPPTSLTEPEIETTMLENLLELPQLALEQVAKLVNDLRSIGSDMTPEVREQAQEVIVASVIVTQIALAGRKL
jgi:hypothetical protein